jgi:hypothetical protein
MKQKTRSELYDPELPDASSVMASLLCVATVYAGRPSLELAKLALSLAEKWGFVVKDYQNLHAQVVPMQSGVH